MLWACFERKRSLQGGNSKLEPSGARDYVDPFAPVPDIYPHYGKLTSKVLISANDNLALLSEDSPGIRYSIGALTPKTVHRSASFRQPA